MLSVLSLTHATAHPEAQAQAYTHHATESSPHTADLHHTEVSPGITVGPDHIHHTNITTKHQQDHLTALFHCTTWKTKDRKHKQVTIVDPPSEYYSSDEQGQQLRR